MIFDYNLLLLRSPSVSFPSKFSFTAIPPSLFLCLPLSHPPLSLYTHACTHHTTYTTPYACTHYTHTHTSHTHTTPNTRTHLPLFLWLAGWSRPGGTLLWQTGEEGNDGGKDEVHHLHGGHRLHMRTGQWPVSGEKKHWLHMRTAQVSDQCQVKKADYTCAQRRSVASVRSKKHWLHSSGQCQVKKALTTHARSTGQ